MKRLGSREGRQDLLEHSRRAAATYDRSRTAAERQAVMARFLNYS